MPEEARICASCGADNRVAARFCRGCGAVLAAPSTSDTEPGTSTIPLPPPPVAVAAPPDPQTTSSPNTRSPADPDAPGWAARNRFAIGGALAALAAAVVVMVLLTGGGDEGSASRPAPTTSRTTAPAPAPPVDTTTDTTAADADADLQAEKEEFAQRLTAMVDASRDGFHDTRAGRWSQAAAVRRGIVRELEAVTTSDAGLAAIRRSFRTAMLASAKANERSTACGDVRYVSDCAMPMHERARKAKERFRERFNRLLDELGEPTIEPRSF